jgi:hypothetical protein
MSCAASKGDSGSEGKLQSAWPHQSHDELEQITAEYLWLAEHKRKEARRAFGPRPDACIPGVWGAGSRRSWIAHGSAARKKRQKRKNVTFPVPQLAQWMLQPLVARRPSSRLEPRYNLGHLHSMGHRRLPDGYFEDGSTAGFDLEQTRGADSA